MGNALGCMPSEEVRSKGKEVSKASLAVTSNGKKNGLSPSICSSKKEDDVDDELVEQAVAAAMLFRHHQRNGSLPFPRSNSVAYPNYKKKQHQAFTKSCSSSNPLFRPTQLLHQDLKTDELETNHFILVHGGGFGAWCWYKIITLLEDSGFKVDAVDLTGAGTNSSDANTITSLSQYIKPLIDILNNLKQGDKVILVGHDIGGACLSYVMELFPSKIAKSVFISATMLSNGQSALDILSQQMESTNLMQKAQLFLYADGKDKPPTAIHLNKQFLKDLLFNQSSAKDIALALVSMRPIPFSPILEKLSLSANNYGSIPRFYIKTLEDCAIPVSLQEEMIKSNPPEQVFQLKGSDHAPFFSKPQGLHRILVEISRIPLKEPLIF